MRVLLCGLFLLLGSLAPAPSIAQTAYLAVSFNAGDPIPESISRLVAMPKPRPTSYTAAMPPLDSGRTPMAYESLETAHDGDNAFFIALPSDSAQATHYCDSLRACLQRAGFLQAKLSLPQNPRGHYKLTAGPCYQLGTIVGPYGRIDTATQRPLTAHNAQGVAALYAKVFADSLSPTDLLTVRLLPEEGRLATAQIVIARGKIHPTLLGVELHGDYRVAKSALLRRLGLRIGAPIPGDLVAFAEAAVDDLPFVAQQGKPIVEFLPKGVRLHLYLTSRRASTAQGSIAMTPAPEGQRGVRFEGQADLQLVNLLHQGERVWLTWQIAQKTQMDLSVQAQYPHIARSPLGVEAAISWQRRDTSELRFAASLGLTFTPLRFHTLRLSYELLRAGYYAPSDPARKVSTKGNCIALGYQYARTRYDLSWPLGQSIRIGTAYALRTQSGYDNSQLLQLEGHLAWCWPLPWHELRAGVKGNYYYQAFTHGPRLRGRLDQFQLGGANSLRGYAERALLTTHALLLSANFGWFANGYIAPSLFLDAALLLDQTPALCIVAPGLSTAFQASRFYLQLDFAKAFPLGKDPTLNHWMVHLSTHLRF